MDDETNLPTCVDGGNLGAACRLGCRAGFEMSGAVDGRCELAGNGTSAAYVGMEVVCDPETDANGDYSEGYCSMAATEAVLDCCESLPPDSPEAADCGEDHPPGTCSVGCAERWQPLKEGCERHLADFTALSAMCDETALQVRFSCPLFAILQFHGSAGHHGPSNFQSTSDVGRQLQFAVPRERAVDHPSQWRALPPGCERPVPPPARYDRRKTP